VKWQYTRQDVIRGLLIYAAGDSMAALLLHEFMWTRLAGMMMTGATFYAFEIPNYFRWIDNRINGKSNYRKSFEKTVLAILYFNPLWIARHLVFIAFFSGKAAWITWDILRIATWSFLVNIPLSLIANYLIQNRIGLRHRFFASAVFSALMAIYYAVSRIIYGG